MHSDKAAFIQHIGMDDVKAYLPEVEAWDGVVHAPDIFITALGFEERAIAIPELLSGQLNACATAIALLGCYKGNSVDNASNSERMNIACEKFCKKVDTFCADTPVEIQCVVQQAITNLLALKRPIYVVFDVSGSSGTLILSVMAALLPMAASIKLDVVYAEPQEYSPLRVDFERSPETLVQEGLGEGNDQSFAEQGVYDVDVNELYPGLNVESRPDRVLAIPSLRTSRLVRCLAHIGDQLLASPQESIFWILGEPPSPSLQWRLELQRMIITRQLAVIAGKEPDEDTAPRLSSDNQMSASTRDYRIILQILLNQIDASAGRNLWLVHMGSKLQAIGVALALQVRSEVTVLRARPVQFNPSRYTKGVSTFWRLSFQDLSELLLQLRKVGQLELQAKVETSRERKPTI